MNKSSVCFYTGSLKQGGAERDIVILANKLVDLNYEVYIVCVFSNEVFFMVDSRVKIIDLTRKIKGRGIKEIFKLSREIVRLQKEYGFNNVICNMIGLNCLLSFLLSGKQCNLVLRIVSDPASWTNRNKILAKLFYKKANIIVSQTKYQLNFFPKKVREKGVIIPNICVTPIQITTPTNFYSKNLIYIGRLNVKIKRIDILLRAYQKFIALHPDYRLFLYGEYADDDGYSQKIITGLIDSNGLSEHVIVKGPTKDVFDVINNAFCLLFSSPHEGMPNAILEAQLSGLPVISSLFPGAEEIINNGVDGLLYQFGNIQDLCEKIELLQSNYSVYVNISNNGKEKFSRYSFSAILDIWQNLLK